MFFDPRKLGTPAISAIPAIFGNEKQDREIGTPAISAIPAIFGDEPTGKNSKIAKIAASPDPQKDGHGLKNSKIAKIAASPDLKTAHRLWLIRHPDGRLVSHSFEPPVTGTEVEGWYPDARSIEMEGEA